MDARVAIFDEAVHACFQDLITEGFAAVPVEESGTLDRRPYSRSITFRSSDAEVTCALVLTFAGGDEIVTRVWTTDGPAADYRAAAHKGQAVRKAVREHAVRAQSELASRPR